MQARAREGSANIRVWSSGQLRLVRSVDRRRSHRVRGRGTSAISDKRAMGCSGSALISSTKLSDYITPSRALRGRQGTMQIDRTHYVLKNPMKEVPDGYKVCVFANGCFWGSEKGAWRLPGGGIYNTAVGYAGGFTPNPTYDECCSGRTGHTEAVRVVFDPAKISFVDILRWFWEVGSYTCVLSWFFGCFHPAYLSFSAPLAPSL